MRLDILCASHIEAGRSHGGVADAIVEAGLHQLDHHTDDMTG